MNIHDLFEKLSYGPLSNLHMSGEGNGSIDEQQQPKILSYTNDALTALYGKFNLLEKDLLIQLVPGVTFYHFLPQYRRSNDTSDIPEYRRYIMDLPEEPYTGDMLRVLAVFDAHGHKMPLNDPDNVFSVFTPQPNTLQVPNPNGTNALGVQYQANHPKLTIENLDAEIFVPEVLMQALTSYIAYLVYTNMNTAESTGKASEHLSMYQSICADVIDRDLVNSSASSTNVRFFKRGWV